MGGLESNVESFSLWSFKGVESSVTMSYMVIGRGSDESFGFRGVVTINNFFFFF